MTRDELNTLYAATLKQPAKAWEYLIDERMLRPGVVKAAGVGYLESIEYRKSTLYDVVVFPVFDCKGNITMLECRTIFHKQYAKFMSDKAHIPLYVDWKRYNKVSTALVVEGVIEALTLRSYASHLQAISTLRASASRSQLHFLRYLFDELSFVLNNDDAGNSNAERILKFYSEIYDYVPYTEEVPAKDLNELLLTDKGTFMRFASSL